MILKKDLHGMVFSRGFYTKGLCEKEDPAPFFIPVSVSLGRGFSGKERQNISFAR